MNEFMSMEEQLLDKLKVGQIGKVKEILESGGTNINYKNI